MEDCFNIDILYTPKTGVICESYTQYVALCQLANMHGLTWRNGDPYIPINKSIYSRGIVFYFASGIYSPIIMPLPDYDKLKFVEIINRKYLFSSFVRDLLDVSYIEENKQIETDFVQNLLLGSSND